MVRQTILAMLVAFILVLATKKASSVEENTQLSDQMSVKLTIVEVCENGEIVFMGNCVADAPLIEEEIVSEEKKFMIYNF